LLQGASLFVLLIAHARDVEGGAGAGPDLGSRHDDTSCPSLRSSSTTSKGKFSSAYKDAKV
jgi:hypothetical protein